MGVEGVWAHIGSKTQTKAGQWQRPERRRVAGVVGVDKAVGAVGGEGVWAHIGSLLVLVKDWKTPTKGSQGQWQRPNQAKGVGGGRSAEGGGGGGGGGGLGTHRKPLNTSKALARAAK